MKAVWFLACLCLAAPSVRAAEYKAASAAEVAAITGKLQSGDVVVLTDGSWKDQVIVFKGRGTVAKPITLRAQTPGKVVLTGKSSLTLDGDYLVVSGIAIKNAGIDGKDGFGIRGSHCRLTESSVVDSTFKFDVHLYGTDNRVDHCYLAGKTSDSPTLQVEVQETPNSHRIDHNYFGPRPPLGRNGGETMRIGYSGQSMRNSRTVVERNLFDRCDGELEIISSKSCENIYRYNTFLDCAGMLTLRHGNRCRVEGNLFLGNNKKGSGGIRVIGDDHVIVGNYIDRVEIGGIWITAGIPNSPLNGYYVARNARIANNTVIDSHGPYLHLDAGFGTSGRTLRPENITITNNLFFLPRDPASATLLKGTAGTGFQWKDNVAVRSGAEDGPAPTGMRTLPWNDGIGARGKDGVWRPAASSGLEGVGFSAAKPSAETGLLTSADIGPSWRASKEKQ
ncbi:MAG: polysaccharide lyase 6 family protein [Armatimonadota bacterium]